MTGWPLGRLLRWLRAAVPGSLPQRVPASRHRPSSGLSRRLGSCRVRWTRGRWGGGFRSSARAVVLGTRLRHDQWEGRAWERDDRTRRHAWRRACFTGRPRWRRSWWARGPVGRFRPLTIHLDFGIVEFALLGQAGEVDTRDELVREEKRYRFSEARMEPSTFDTHNCDASRRGASLPRRTWPTSDPVSGRSGCGSGWAHQEPSKTVQLKRSTCQREVLGITRKRRATRRSRTGDLLITNS